MEKIKIKAWHKATEIWLPDDVIMQYITIVNGEMVVPTDVILVLFTGLYDKKGKEVYDGDVVRDHLEPTDEVVWDKTVAGFEFLSIPNNETRDAWMPSYDTVARDYEVIGNIYDNPELLK